MACGRAVVGPNAGGRVAYLIAGTRSVRLELTKLDNSDDFNAAIRNGATLAFAATFTHPGGHEMTLALPALHAARSEERGLPSQTIRAHPSLEAATDPAGTDVVYEVGLLGATSTTTTAP